MRVSGNGAYAAGSGRSVERALRIKIESVNELLQSSICNLSKLLSPILYINMADACL